MVNISGETYDIFHWSGKTPIARDRLNIINKGVDKTNLHCIKNVPEILSGPEQVQVTIIDFIELIINIANSQSA